MAMITPERDLEESLVTKLRDLKYEYRPDIRDRATLEANFRKKFEALNRVTLTDGEFQRLLDEIVTPDVYEAARSLRNREAFIRADGTPLKLHPRQHQGLVQKPLRSRQSAPHQYGQQPSPLRRHAPDQRRPRRSDRTKDAWDQPPAGDGADRRLQERPR